MRKLILSLAALAVSACSGAAQVEPVKSESSMTIYDVEFTRVTGEALPFSAFEGQAVLVVNTASRCGYTPQYAGLQELHDTFKDQGFTVLGVPSNDFGGQEPGTEAQIKSFCEINFGVEFPLTSKVNAIGPNQHAFWKAAKAQIGDKAEPNWNFHKVLVGKDGTVLQAYPSSVKPADAELVADIERALAG